MSNFDPQKFIHEFRQEAADKKFRSTPLVDTPAGSILGFSKPGKGAPIYLSSGIHGDEPAGPLALLELLRSDTFSSDRHWILCPMLNPTGLAAGTRNNAGDYDLNRDYLQLKTEEVRAHVKWLKSLPVPKLFISLHEDWETTGYYFYEINLGEDCPERANSILEAVAPWFQPEPNRVIDDHEVRELGWIYHRAHPDFPDHWPEAIFMSNRKCPISFTLEAPSSKKLSDRIKAHCAAVRSILSFFEKE